MSINNIANTVFPNTLSGLDSINVSDITINGVDVTTLFVPYTGANTNVDLNNKNLSAVNNVGTTTVVATGSVQGGSFTTTGLTTTNTLKVNSVPAGTTSKYLATDSAGNVIEANITTTYVPYTGATSHVNLNARNLSNVLTYSGTNLQVTSTETTSLLATGLAQLGTLRISSVPAGTQTNLLAVNSTGDVIIGTAPPSSQLNLSPTTAPTLYYFPFITSASAGVQTVYTDNAVITLTYDTATKILSPYRLKIQNVPVGTQTSLLAIDSAGNVIQGTSTPPTQLLTTRTSPVPSQIYYPTFVSTNTTGDKSYFVPYPSTAGYDIIYDMGGTVGDIGTLTVPQLVISLTCILPATATSFNGTPLTTGSPVVYGLGIDANNLIKAYNAGSPNVTVTSTNATYYPVFVSTTMTSGIKDLYQDTLGGDFNYNPSTNLLTVSNLTVSGTTTISGYAILASPAFTGVPTAPTAGSGTNTTQLATTAFVQTAVAGVTGYLPLAGGTMTGTISFASGTNNLLSMYYNKFNQYTNYIIDGGGNQYIAIATDAPSASPSPLVGTLSLLRNTSITGTLTNSSTLVSTGKITGNGGLTITNASVLYANIGIGGVNNIYADTQFWTSGGANGVMQISYGTGINQNIDSGTSYNWQTTNAGVGTTCLNLSASQVAFRMGSMFDFSVAGTWDNSNALFVTTGGNGGTNSGVGIGFNTTLNSGLLASIAPNVAWKRMSYKAEEHYFYTSGNTLMAGMNPVGLFANNAGYMTNSVGAANAGLTGFSTGDLIFFANSSQVMRFYTGTSCRIAMGANQIYADTIVPFTNPSAVSVGGVNIWRDTTNLNLVVGTSVPTTGLGGNTNIIFGYECGRNITSGVQNVLMGVVGTGDNITTGNQNTLIGYQAGRIISTGSLNTAIGQQALAGGGPATCTGNYNCAIGHFTLTTITNGSFNSALGVGAGTGLTTGNFCCYIGTNAQPSAAGVSNEVVISSTGSAVGKGGNTFFTQAGASYNGANSNVWNTISDRNIKTNIVPLTNELHKLLALRPVHFDYKETGAHGCSFIAQEWKEIFPELHTTAAPNEYQRKVLGLTKVEGILTDIVPHIVRGIQEQQEQITKQQEQITKQQEQITKQQEQIDLLLKHVSLLTDQVNELTKQMKK